LPAALIVDIRAGPGSGIARAIKKNTTMNKAVCLALLAGGIVLIVYGVNASNSVASSFSRMFTGNPTDRTGWLLVGGIAATVVGLVGFLAGGSKST
jgi:uncharacterized BrkB/YihY/UPF0761 family membrane protein